MRRTLWILITPLAGFLILFVVFKMWLGPSLEQWALKKSTDYVNTHLPIQLKAKQLHLSLFKPFISLEGIDVEAKSDLAETIKSVHIDNVQVHIDFFQLLGGRLTLSAIIVDGPQIKIDIDPLLKNEGPAKELPVDAFFAQIEKLPLQRLFVKNLDLEVNSNKLLLDGQLVNGDLLATLKGGSVIIKTVLPALKVSHKTAGAFYGSFDSQLFLTRQFLRIIQFSIRTDESDFTAHGELTGLKQLLTKPTGFINGSANINLNDIYNELKKSKLKIPTFAGKISLDIETRFDGLDDVTGKTDIITQSLTFDKFELGNARIKGTYKDRAITLSQIKIQHPAGEALLTDTEMTLDKNFDFKTKVSLTDLDLQNLFQTLDLKNIPVGAEIVGDVPCEGRIRPFFQINCSNTSLKARDFWVKAENKPSAKSILQLNSLAVSGQVQITKKSINYAAKVNIGSSSGTSDGVVDFKDGFKINFKTKKLDFKNIQNLAGLNLKGSASIEGSTSGGTQSAIFNMNLNAQDFVFEGFALGNLIAQLKYRSGHLAFADIAGALNKTQYLGDLDLNFNNDTLQGDFRSPSVDIADVGIIIQNLIKFPVEVQGVGAARAHIQGPLDFWKMTFDVESAFKKVRIGPEIFDQLNFDVSAKNGNIKTDNVLLRRGNGSLKVQGQIGSDQIMNLSADGKNWKLEESTVISGINTSITGNLNFSAEIKDSIKSPHLMIKGAVTDTLFEEQEFPNSNFILRLNKENLATRISLFGDKVQGEIQLPFEKDKSPLIIKAKTNDWNYASLLTLIGGSNLAGEYSSSLTSSVDLRSESGEFFKSSGKMTIQNIYLKRGALSFENHGLVEVTSNNGFVTIKNFNLEGPKNSLQIRGENFTAQKLNLSVNVQADMRLMQIFAPFLEDLSGPLSLSTTVSGDIKKPEILGNLNTKNAFVKIKNFPHAIEKLLTDIVFSQSKILINKIEGQIAGGTLNGDGAVLINGIKNIPTTVNLRLDGVTFNVPDKVKSSGHAELLFSGSWFPFTLSGTYHVSSALVEKEFTEESGGVAGVKQSIYLPKVIREGQFEAILLDLKVILEKNILIKNSLLDAAVTGHLQIKGPPANPILLGKITTEKKSKLIFKDKIFEIQNGVIDFEDPNEINPNLYIAAQSRINEYDVSLLAQGPSKNVGIRLTSVPPLPEQDIISLIALGITSSTSTSNLQAGNQQQTEQQLGLEIGGAVLAKPISKRLESTLGLNLQVTSQYDSTRNISVPKITLSRRLSERVKFSGSRPVGNVQSYDLKLEYLLNNNITAVGSFESRGIDETTSTLQRTQPETQSIFGIDLEFKREFK
ncbi:MAG: translocation/assembly module TamB domain-containing protein [Bdellovibrio sp.]